MIFDVPALIEFLSRSTTLLPGALIFTGTPAGVGMGQNPPRWLADGDEVSVVIEGIGTLSNRVRRGEGGNPLNAFDPWWRKSVAPPSSPPPRMPGTVPGRFASPAPTR
jgi:hypothetical protein